MPYMAATNLNHNTLIFASCAEIQPGLTQILPSTNGLTWTTLTSTPITPSEDRWNHLTTHPRSNTIFGTLKPGLTYQIKTNPQTTPTQPPPTPTPTSAPLSTPAITPQPTTQTPTQSSTPNPASTPDITTQTPGPTPSPSSSQQLAAINPTPQPTTITKITQTTPTTTQPPPATPIQTPSKSTPPPSQTTPLPPKTSGTAKVNYTEIALITSMITAASLLSVVAIKKRRQNKHTNPQQKHLIIQ